MAYYHSENYDPEEPSRQKKVPFTQSEKGLLVRLIKKWHILEDRSTKADSVSKKKRAWLELSKSFNSQSYTTNRTGFQLKRCWENMKTARKKELAVVAQITGRKPISTDSMYSNTSFPETIDSNLLDQPESEIMLLSPELDNLTDRKDVVMETSEDFTKNIAEPEPTEQESFHRRKIPSRVKKFTEGDFRFKRFLKDMAREDELHDIRIRKEKVILEREKVMLDKEKILLEKECEELEFQRKLNRIKLDKA